MARPRPILAISAALLGLVAAPTHTTADPAIAPHIAWAGFEAAAAFVDDQGRVEVALSNPGASRFGRSRVLSLPGATAVEVGTDILDTTTVVWSSQDEAGRTFVQVTSNALGSWSIPTTIATGIGRFCPSGRSSRA